MFTKENTQGFTAQQLETLNAALVDLIEAGIDEDNASDLINNSFFEDATITDLIKRHINKSFYAVSEGIAEACNPEEFDHEDNDSVLTFCRSKREALLIAEMYDDCLIGYDNCQNDCGETVAAVTASDEQLDAAAQ